MARRSFAAIQPLDNLKMCYDSAAKLDSPPRYGSCVSEIRILSFECYVRTCRYFVCEPMCLVSASCKRHHSLLHRHHILLPRHQITYVRMLPWRRILLHARPGLSIVVLFSSFSPPLLVSSPLSPFISSYSLLFSSPRLLSSQVSPPCKTFTKFQPLKHLKQH